MTRYPAWWVKYNYILVLPDLCTSYVIQGNGLCIGAVLNEFLFTCLGVFGIEVDKFDPLKGWIKATLDAGPRGEPTSGAWKTLSPG